MEWDYFKLHLRGVAYIPVLFEAGVLYMFSVKEQVPNPPVVFYSF